MFVFVEKLLRDFHLRKKRGLVQIAYLARFFMLARLPQITAIAGTVNRHLALFATALWTNASVEGGTEPLFLTSFTDGATQCVRISLAIIPRSASWLDRLA